MKKLMLLIPVLLLSCNKNEVVNKTSANNDSVATVDKNVVEHSRDSVRDGMISIDEPNSAEEISDKSRVVEVNRIIKTVNGDRLPLKITDEFTQKEQHFTLKIKNFKAGKIIGSITPENSQMNVRFNQIKLPNGDYDGPFGREINYDVKENGEIWLLIGKSNMASGKTTGKFTLDLK